MRVISLSRVRNSELKRPTGVRKNVTDGVGGTFVKWYMERIGKERLT